MNPPRPGPRGRIRSLAGGPGFLTLVLALAVLAVFLLRFVPLSASPYPPSSDAGGDLFGLHRWSGLAPPAAAPYPYLPPGYYVAVIAPATILLPTFLGLEVAMALVPALIVLPAYALFRSGGLAPPTSVLAAVMLAGSAAFSLMTTWNSAYNLFGILLLVAVLALLPGALRSGRWTRVGAAAAAFGLVAAAHMLTFLVAAIAAVSIGVAYGLETGRPTRPRLRRLALVGGALGAAAAPFSLLYLSYLRTQVNAGIGPFGAALPTVVGQAWFFPWGSQVGPIPPFALLDLGLVAAGIYLWAFRRRADPLYVAGLAGVIVAALSVPLLDASEAVRGLYFLPIPLVAALAQAMDALLARAPAVAAQPDPRPGRARDARRALRRLTNGPGVRLAAVGALAVVLLSTNLLYSVEVTQEGAQFYRVLTPQRVAALDWLSAHTPPGAAVYDGAGLSPWVWGYANRADYAPAPLANEATAASYRAALWADYLDMGSFLAGSGGLIVATNAPSPVGSPGLFVAVPGNWVPLATSVAADDSLTVTENGTATNLSVAAGELVGARSFGAPGTEVGYDLSYRWTPEQIVAHQILAVGPSGARIAWSVADGTVDSATWSFGILPSGYLLNYHLPDVTDAANLSAAFSSPSGARFSVAFEGASVSAVNEPNGWLRVVVRAATFVVSTGGLLAPLSTAFTLDTQQLWAALGIGYALVDYDRDYRMFTRLEAGVPGELSAALLDRSGTLFIFGVTAA